MKKKRKLWIRWPFIFLWVIYGIAVVLGSLLDGRLAPIVGLGIGSLVAFSCAGKCVEWSEKIDAGPNFAYAVGFIGGVVGLLIYWIYYKINKGEKQ